MYWEQPFTHPVVVHPFISSDCNDLFHSSQPTACRDIFGNTMKFLFFVYSALDE